MTRAAATLTSRSSPPAPRREHGPWHALEPAQVVARLGSDPVHGLTDGEAEARLARHGPNVLTQRARESTLRRFLRQFHAPLIYILLVAAAITSALGEWVDAAVILGVVLVNAIVGFVQESRAVRAIESLAKSMVSEATVLRGGRQERVGSEKLVPGDVVVLASGDKAPADLRLIDVRDLQVDESALTGESVPVEKSVRAVEPDTSLADRKCMAYASTMVTYGRARGVVTATGDHTEVGRISELISTADSLKTPLTRKIAAFSHVLLLVIIVLAAITFGLGLSQARPFSEAFMSAVALMVGAIPEGLPAAMTIMLALGVSRMARRRAIIRKLPAVETLGSTTVICSDKTGTLTQNQMTVLKVWAAGEAFEVSGLGYQPEGQLHVGGERAEPRAHPALARCLEIGLLTNDSRLVEKDGRWLVEGDPTEGALLAASAKAGLSREELEVIRPRIDAIPFESEHQYMATLHLTNGQAAPVAYLKGSLEAILARSSEMLSPRGERVPLDPGAIQREAEAMSAAGLRVLAFAELELPPGRSELLHEHVASGLTLVGLQGMIDPPREEAKVAIEACRRAGIAVKMITGDHALTAASIAGQLGIRGETREGRLAAMTGRELEGVEEAALSATAERVSVFARVTPEQKLRLVRALQSKGHVVAMTGDGVNDAPALEQADIGVAMGISGTDVAKDAADMVLTDDNFASIEAAVEEGRAVFDNLTKFIVWTLPTNLGEALIILAAAILGTALPALPVQILWVNMSTAVLLGLTLAFEPQEPDVMHRPPRPAKQPILTRDLILRTLLVGVLLLITSFGAFELLLHWGADLAVARTTAVNVLVFGELFYLFNCRSLVKPLHQIGFFTNPWVFAGAAAMVVVQLIFTYVPVMNQAFGSAPLGLTEWLLILGAGVIIFMTVSAEKSVRYFASKRREAVPLEGSA